MNLLIKELIGLRNILKFKEGIEEPTKSDNGNPAKTRVRNFLFPTAQDPNRSK